MSKDNTIHTLEFAVKETAEKLNQNNNYGPSYFAEDWFETQK